MTTTLETSDFQAELQHLDALLQELERWADPQAQSRVREIVQAILRMHSAGLEHLLGHLESAGEPGRTVLATCTRDPLVEGMLLLHGLHPQDVEARVREALEEVRPALRAHGGNVELVEISEDVVRLRLQGNCHSCPSSSVTMQQTIEQAILGKAPEVGAVEVENAEEFVPVGEDGAARRALPLL
jgi:Fe-S cluster biogenesis protein NfuA